VTPVNFQIALNAFCNRRPFRPFVVELVSGDRFRVRHPEALVLRGTLAVYNAPNQAIRLFDSESVCQLGDESALTPPAN
jgi:hypothetical protein